MTEENGIEWASVSPEMARQILDQAETFMQAQLQAGIAADQRAITAASIFAAVSSALIGGSLAYWSAGDAPETSMVAAGLVSGITMSLAAYGCFFSASPSAFYYPGNQPENWWEVVGDDLTVAIGGECENYQSHIKKNELLLEKNACIFKWSMGAALAAPILALFTWLAFICPTS
jgi:hypothetical protein